MDKYKSKYVKEEDLIINVSKRTIGLFVTSIVEIKHKPTGFIASAENDRQLQAYNLAMEELENKLIKQGYIKRKPAIINEDFEKAVKEMEESSKSNKRRV